MQYNHRSNFFFCIEKHFSIKSQSKEWKLVFHKFFSCFHISNINFLLRTFIRQDWYDWVCVCVCMYNNVSLRVKARRKPIFFCVYFFFFSYIYLQAWLKMIDTIFLADLWMNVYWSCVKKKKILPLYHFILRFFCLSSGKELLQVSFYIIFAEWSASHSLMNNHKWHKWNI